MAAAVGRETGGHVAFRFHRSIRLFPGLRLNFSKSGLGFSAGFKGFHISRSPDGRMRRTVSIPGTGASWITRLPGHGPAGGGVGRSAPAPNSPPPPPPMTADEERLCDAIRADDLDTISAIGRGSTSVAFAAKVLTALELLDADRDGEALVVLEELFATGLDPLDDPFVRERLQVTISIEVSDGASVEVAPDRTTIGLFLGELHQRLGDLDRAIAVVHELPRTTLTALSLADLFDAAGRFDDVIDVTEDAPNADDASSLLWVLRGVAFGEKKAYAAAYPCFAKVIRCTSRNDVVLHRARFERARCATAEGHFARARKDLGRIMAEDSDFPGVAAALADLRSRATTG